MQITNNFVPIRFKHQINKINKTLDEQINDAKKKEEYNNKWYDALLFSMFCASLSGIGYIGGKIEDIRQNNNDNHKSDTEIVIDSTKTNQEIPKDTLLLKTEDFKIK